MFNLEVDADHCYRVGEQGILVHNASVYRQLKQQDAVFPSGKLTLGAFTAKDYRTDADLASGKKVLEATVTADQVDVGVALPLLPRDAMGEPFTGVVYFVFSTPLSILLKVGTTTSPSTARRNRWNEYKKWLGLEHDAWLGQGHHNLRILFILVKENDATQTETDARKAIDSLGTILMPWDYKGRTGKFASMNMMKPKDFGGQGLGLDNLGYLFSCWYESFGLTSPYSD